MTELLKQLCLLDGVAGFENEVREFISLRVKELGLTPKCDRQGSLFVFKKGEASPPRPIMLCAHMDEVGFLIKSVTDDGMFKITPAGGIDPRVLIGCKMKVGKSKIPGVISLKAIHLTTVEERKKAPELKELYIDIGAESREEAEKYARTGDTAVFDSDFALMGSDCVKAKALDDRIGCAVLLKLMEQDLPFDTHFVFTTSEEIGARGAVNAIQRIDPGFFAAVDSTTAGDLPDVPEHLCSCKLREGAVVSLIDRGAVYDRALREKITASAHRQCVRWQYRIRPEGATDSSSYIHGTGTRLFGLSTPVRYIHTSCSVAYLPDIEDVLRVARIFIEEAGEMNA